MKYKQPTPASTNRFQLVPGEFQPVPQPGWGGQLCLWLQQRQWSQTGGVLDFTSQENKQPSWSIRRGTLWQGWWALTRGQQETPSAMLPTSGDSGSSRFSRQSEESKQTNNQFFSRGYICSHVCCSLPVQVHMHIRWNNLVKRIHKILWEQIMSAIIDQL